MSNQVPEKPAAGQPDCTDCRYFHETLPASSEYFPPDGECHFDPPKTDRNWPRVRGDDWCGKHSPAKP
jgi:hypothetical protein